MEFRLLLSLSTLAFTLASEWNYEGQGPDYWIHEYPRCAGRLQSPIDIQESNAIYDSKLGNINFHNYEWPLYWNISNNGHTIIANQLYNESLTPYITGSDFLPGVKYHLQQFHFHWGFNIYQGSEHHIDNKKFPLEIHLVHSSNLNETTVVAFVFQIDKEDNEKIAALISEVGNEDSVSDFNVTKFSLSLLLPTKDLLEKDGYFRYMGSLTTPPCTEGVKWTVFRTKINISEAQMNQFFKNEIEFNNREVQQLNDRKLFINVPNGQLSSTESPDITSGQPPLTICRIFILTLIVHLIYFLLESIDI
ncbi:carbonic anhydrase 15-like [Brachionus plicatilis]|uniref:Carbonic anhydrase n=1 Tax=Brachionus plicatilis TaxID=10195 RepID=A0A3M7RP18_BRAPC|nr:carbonic anhydrase 15-like [Brachionus plicatilis]